MIAHINRFFFVVLFLAFAGLAQASSYSHPTITRLLQADEQPDGVVFELLSWDDATWSWAAPMIADLRDQLKKKYPDVDVAIVSHGGEQFQLTKESAKQQPQAIATLQDLTDEGVNLHVCGTHSSWQDVPDTAYIDIVDVAPSAPAQVNDYIKLGYTHILLQAGD